MRWSDSATVLLCMLLCSVMQPVVSQPDTGDETARPLEGRGLQNLIAFTRLLGYVRYFHPSDGAAAADWDSIAIDGVRTVEQARDAPDLAEALEQVFRPLAPTVRVVPSGTAFDSIQFASRPAAADQSIVAWLHHWTSERVDIRDPESAGVAIFQRTIDAARFRGKVMTFRAAARTESSAELFVRISEHEDEQARVDPRGSEARSSRESLLVTSDAWATYDVKVAVPANAEVIRYGIEIAGQGKSWIDGISILVDPSSVTDLHERQDFEDKTTPVDWILNSRAVMGTYRVGTDASEPWSGSRCALIDGSTVDRDPFPRPEEPWIAELEGGVTAYVPISLYADAAGTLPRSNHRSHDGTVERPDTEVRSGNDRSTRLAAVALAWNLPQHFYAYFDVVETDWKAALREALAAAAADSDERAFVDTLRRMLVALRDGHALVNHASDKTNHRPPFVWRWVDEQVVVTHVLEGESDDVRPGDVILSVNGVPTAKALDRISSRISSATRQGQRYWTLLYLGADVGEQPVTLEVSRPDGSLHLVTTHLKRARLTVDEPRPTSFHDAAPGVVYVDLGRVTTEEFEASLDKLVAAKGIILDLRGYPRVDVPTVLSRLTDRPLMSPPIYKAVQIRPDRAGMNFTLSRWSISPAAPRIHGRVVVLTDGRAISAAETLLAIVKHYRLATIVGFPSAGTNGAAYPVVLPGGYRFKWTGSKVTNYDGSRHHGIGVIPDVPIVRTRNGAAEKRDEALECAIQIILDRRDP